MTDPSEGYRPSTTDVARSLLARRIMPIPLPYGQKNPNRRNWDEERYTQDDLTAFQGKVGVGMRLGYITGKDGAVLTDRFVDVDLDTMEAVRVASLYLPPTNMIWGRGGKPRSHYGYRLTSPEGVKDFKCNDPNIRRNVPDGPKAMLCELRWTGQTVAPGSVNTQDGREDWVRWEADGDGPPGEVDYGVLVERVALVGATSLIARYWTEGVRHVAALPLSGLLCRGGMSEEDAITFMRAVCLGANDTHLENRLACVRDTYSRARAGDVYTGANTLAEYFPPTVVIRVRKWTKLGTGAYGGDIGPDGKPLTDIGNAERFGEKWDGQLLYCDEERTWYGLEASRWIRDRENKVYLLAREVCNDFRQMANNPSQQTRGNTTVDQWLRHSLKMGDAKQINAMLALSRALLPTVSEAFDSHPFLLNVQNGTLELDVTNGNVTLRAHRAEDMLTMMAPVSYNPDATNPLFDEFLGLFYPDQELADFLQEHVGYLLTGLPKRYSLELIGPTNAGKSMTLELFGNMLGDYAASLSYDSLMKSGRSGGDVPRPDLWRVRNKRLVTVAEVPPDVRYDVALFKTLLSGGDAKHIRTLFDRSGGADIQFKFALWTSGNKPYGPPSSEAAAYERLHVLRCEQQVPREQRRQQKQLLTINPAITGDAALAWAVRGFTRLYREKHGILVPPEKVRRSTDEMQNTLDPWNDAIERLFEVTNDPNDGVLKTEAWLFAKAEREMDAPVRNPRQAQWEYEASLERRVGPARQSMRRWRNARYWPGLRWSQPAAEKWRVTQPDWSND